MKNKKTTRAWAEIDVSAIEHNIKEVRKSLKPHTMIMGVVKADGYGHGASGVSKIMVENGVEKLAVAEIHEAISIREDGIDAPILILGATDFYDYPLLLKYDVMATVFSYEQAERLSHLAKKEGKLAKIHIKIDSGMSRLGFKADDAAIDEIVKISALSNIEIEGIYTHLACADLKDDAREITKMQYDLFMDFVTKLEKNNVSIQVKHIANSAAISRFPEYQLDMVRAGIILYGYLPDKDMETCLDLKPAMTLKAKITRLHTVKKGTPVSYGFSYVTQKEETKIATVPIGYADGYMRALSKGVYMSAKNINVPVIGKICMDQCMIDVTSVNNINVGDEVIIFGNGENSTQTAQTLADTANTISYEILCIVGKRIPHVFVKNGAIW